MVILMVEHRGQLVALEDVDRRIAQVDGRPQDTENEGLDVATADHTQLYPVDRLDAGHLVESPTEATRAPEIQAQQDGPQGKDADAGELEDEHRIDPD